MASIIDSHRNGAIIVYGDEAAKAKRAEILSELGLPEGLLPLRGVKEFGYNPTTGFMWHVLESKIEHTFDKIKQTVSYDVEVTGFGEKGRFKNITGVKAKELLIWLSVVDMFVPEGKPTKITFKTASGLADTFDAAAFALE